MVVWSRLSNPKVLNENKGGIQWGRPRTPKSDWVQILVLLRNLEQLLSVCLCLHMCTWPCRCTHPRPWMCRPEKNIGLLHCHSSSWDRPSHGASWAGQGVLWLTALGLYVVWPASHVCAGDSNSTSCRAKLFLPLVPSPQCSLPKPTVT